MSIEYSKSNIKRQKKKKERQDNYFKKQNGNVNTFKLSIEEVNIMCENMKRKKQGKDELEVKYNGDFSYLDKSKKLIDALKLNGVYQEYLEYDKDFKELAIRGNNFYQYPFIMLKCYNEEITIRKPVYKDHDIILNYFNQDNAFDWFMNEYNKNKKWLYKSWNSLKLRK